MENKYMTLQLDQTFGEFLKESIVNIQDLSVNYNDTLYAYCPKLQKQVEWIGVCMNCYEDHQNQIKVVKLDNGYAIQGSEQYFMIDIVNFSKMAIPSLRSELKTVFDDCQAQQQIQGQAIHLVIEYIVKRAILIIIEQQKQDSFGIFSQKNNLNITYDLEFIVECNKQTQQWKGYCPKCRKNEKHRISVQQVPFSRRRTSKSNQNQFSKVLLINEIHDYRIIDFNIFQIKVQKYLENKVCEIFLNKIYQILSNQSNIIIGINQNSKQNKDSIEKLEQELKNNQERKQQYQSKQNLLQMNQEKYQSEVQDISQVVRQLEEGSLYDIQINCANLSDLTTDQGWKVVKNEVYEQHKNLNCSVVSFYGLYNKGKSFLASKLSGKIIQNGYSISTIGLSALYPRDLSRENSIIFLDTAGLETPINHHKKDAIYTQISEQNQQKSEEVRQSKIYEAKLSDRLRTENLIQQFVLNQSHLILLIVDQLSKEEQKLIKRIRSKYLQSEIIIVHNFSKLTNQQDIQKYIKIDIENSFEKVESQFRQLENGISEFVYIESRFDDKGIELTPITHVVMAKEQSEAGNKYNSFCYRYLQSRMISIHQFNKFDIIKCLTDEVDKQIVNLFKLTTEQRKQEYKLQFDENKNSITTNIKLTELKPISFDMLGDMQAYDEEEAPKYNYQVTKENFILQIELNGKFEPQKEDQEEKFKKFICLCKTSGCSLIEWHTFINGEQFIQLRAQYQGPDSNILEKPAINADKEQRVNRFKLIIPISPTIVVLKPSRPKFSFELGIAKLEFQIQKTQQLQE